MHSSVVGAMEVSITQSLVSLRSKAVSSTSSSSQGGSLGCALALGLEGVDTAVVADSAPAAPTVVAWVVALVIGRMCGVVGLP